MARFFEFTSDNYGSAPHPRWQLTIEPELENGEWWDVWAYSRGQPAQPPPYPFTVFAPGPKSELNIMTFGIYLVSQRVADVIERLAHDEIQLIPATLEGDPDRWLILNTLSIVDCIDYQRSIIDSYYPDDFHDPAKAGKPRGIVKLVIDPEKVGDHQIFRVKKWNVAMIVTEHLKTLLEESWAIGLRFEEVTPVIPRERNGDGSN